MGHCERKLKQTTHGKTEQDNMRKIEIQRELAADKNDKKQGPQRTQTHNKLDNMNVTR